MCGHHANGDWSAQQCSLLGYRHRVGGGLGISGVGVSRKEGEG